MTADELSAILDQAEFHKFLNLEVVEVNAEGALTLKLAFDEKYTLFKKAGAYHGGVIASLADVAGTMACTVVAGAPTPTANLRTDYLKPPVLCDLYADAQPRQMGRRICVADVTIRDDAANVYAIARGTFSVPASK